MRHAPVSISFSTRDLLSFFSFRAHLLGGGRRPPERTRLNSAVRHQLGSRFVLPWGSTDDSGGPGRDHSSIRARWLMRTASLSPHSGCPEPGEAGGPITYSAPLGGTRPFSGTPRVSTPAPELLVIDAFLQHAVQAQHQLARHRHHRYCMGLLPRPQAAEEPSQVFFVLHGTPGGFHQQESQQAVALLGDVAVARGVAAGMLAGVQPAVGGDAASAVEAGDRLERVHHGQRSLQAHAGMGTHAHQPVAIAQQRQGVLAGRRGPVHDGKLLAPVVFLPAPGELSNRVGIAHQQPVPRLLDQLVEPQRIARGLDAHHRGSGELPVERAHVVAAVVERVLVDLSVGCIHPADGLGADMQVNSDVHCHSRLLFKPKPNGSGREYQLSPRRRVSHDITYKQWGDPPCLLPSAFYLLPSSPLPCVRARKRKADRQECLSYFAILPRMIAEDAKKIFLIDAMGYIFRAYHAPMERLRSPQGIPTKVPYVFANMLRRLMKDWEPEYLAVVFDVTAPTFRDKLFAQYKAQRPPMPEDLSLQLPYVRRLCEAMRLPILEYEGYEADDVIGALALQAAAKKLDVYIVTSDKDMLQLVRTSARGAGGVRVLIPTKQDLVVDEAKVEELLGVPPSKVPDVMALMGDSIDNIPGARDPNEKPDPDKKRTPGIGEVGARELIRQFGSAEEALRRAEEVKRPTYREALKKYGDFVLLSKQLATINTDAPVALSLDALRRREPDVEALRSLYAALGFTSLLRELAPLAGSPATDGSPTLTTDYAQLDSPAAVREFLADVPREQEIALWFSLAPGEREEEGYGSRVAAIELSPRPGVARTAWFDDAGEILAALRPWLADPKRPKIVHDPKLAELLVGPVAGIRHATMLYSYLLRPTTANHDHAEVVLRHFSVTLSGVAGERADYLQRLVPVLRREIESRELVAVYEQIDLPLAPVLAAMEGHGVRVDPQALEAMSATMEGEVRGLERQIDRKSVV